MFVNPFSVSISDYSAQVGAVWRSLSSQRAGIVPPRPAAHPTLRPSTVPIITGAPAESRRYSAHRAWRSWELARNGAIAKNEDDSFAKGELAFANWSESHFRSFLSALTYQKIADTVGVSVDTAHRAARDIVISEIGNERGQTGTC